MNGYEAAMTSALGRRCLRSSYGHSPASSHTSENDSGVMPSCDRTESQCSSSAPSRLAKYGQAHPDSVLRFSSEHSFEISSGVPDLRSGSSLIIGQEEAERPWRPMHTTPPMAEHSRRTCACWDFVRVR